MTRRGAIAALAAVLLLVSAGATATLWRRHEHAQAVRSYRHAELVLSRLSLPTQLGVRSANPVCTPAPDRLCSQTTLWPNQTVAPLLKLLGPGAWVQRPGDCTDWNPNPGDLLTSLKKLPCTLHGHIGGQQAVATRFRTSFRSTGHPCPQARFISAGERSTSTTSEPTL